MRALVHTMLVAVLLLASLGLEDATHVAAGGFPTVDGQFSGVGKIQPQGTLDITVTGRGGVPATGVDSVAINVAVTNPTAPSFLTVFPTGHTRPTAASLNFDTGQTIANMVIAKVGSAGQISIYNLAGTVDVIIDVVGWFPTGGGYTSLNPARLADTRPTFPTVDAQFSGVGKIQPQGTLDITVTGRGGVPATGVDSVAINVAVTNPSAPSFLTVFPTGHTRPTAASLNFDTGQTIANMVIAKVGAGGQISIYNLAGTVDVIIDVVGWFPTGGGYTSLNPARLADTRPTFPTVDAQFSGVGKIQPQGTLDITVTGRGGVPATGVDSVAINVAVTNPSAPSFLTVFPTGHTRPTAASLNFDTGQTIANMVIAKVGTAGQISIYNLAGTVDAIIDVVGWFPTGGGYTSLNPTRLADTRTTSDPPPAGLTAPLALDVLATIPVALEHPAGYSRTLFNHWITQPNGCSTREAVLIRDSLTFAQVDPVGCTVVAGDWLSSYDGATWQNPSDVDIDHVVALKETWDSGAWSWTPARREAFANDLTDRRTLRVVTDNVNQSKGDADPSNWMPPLQSAWCSYLADWVAIKARWSLTMDQSEFGRVRNLLTAQCPGLTIEPFAPVP